LSDMCRWLCHGQEVELHSLYATTISLAGPDRCSTPILGKCEIHAVDAKEAILAAISTRIHMADKIIVVFRTIGPVSDAGAMHLVPWESFEVLMNFRVTPCVNNTFIKRNRSTNTMPPPKVEPKVEDEFEDGGAFAKVNRI
jgi:hypothetical protein